MNTLTLDARKDNRAALRQLRKAARVQSRPLREIVVVDYGDDDSEALLLEALAFRTEHPHCQISVLNRLDPHWSDAECLLRMHGYRGRETIDADGSLFNRAVAGTEQYQVRISSHAIAFEYAA